MIPNGWQSKRLRFLLEVHCSHAFGTEIYYFNGFSESMGLHTDGLNATIDPRMEFFINSYLKINRTDDHTGMSPTGYNDQLVESAHVVNGRFHSDITGRPVYSTRPMDVFTGVQSSYITNVMSEYEGGTVLDDRIDQSGTVTRSTRANDIPSSYLTRVIDTYRSASQLADFGQGQDDVLNRAIQTAYEPDPFENPFIKALNNIYGQMNKVSFTLEDLEMVSPGCTQQGPGQRVQYMEMTQGFPVHQSGESEYWGGTDIETQASTIVAQGASALMMEARLIQIGFTYSNRLPGGQYQCVPLEDTIQGFTSVNMEQYIAHFLRRFSTEVMPDITQNGLIGVDVMVFADLFGDTRVEISVEGGYAKPYVVPQFADSLMVPTITVNQANYNNLLSGVEEIVNNVSGVRGAGNSMIRNV